jgi:hypothetical protein
MVPDFHIVPSTQNLWFAGTQNATHLIITYSVMEAMAFITFNRHRFPRLEQLAFIAIGNKLHAEQGDWIRQSFPGRKVILVFGKDLVGHITDIKLAAAIKNIPIRIFIRMRKFIFIAITAYRFSIRSRYPCMLSRRPFPFAPVSEPASRFGH